MRAEGPLRDQIRDLLRAAVLSGQLRPGLVYSARALADQLGVSPTPVREAMFELVRRGLLEPRRNRGFVLCTYSAADRAQLASVLYLLERHVCVMDTAAQSAAFDELEGHAIRTRLAAEAGDAAAFLESEERFHHRLCMLSENRALGEAVLDLRARVRLHDLTRPEPTAVELLDRSAEHFELIRLLRLGDSAAALQVLEHHIVGDREEVPRAADR